MSKRDRQISAGIGDAFLRHFLGHCCGLRRKPKNRCFQTVTKVGHNTIRARPSATSFELHAEASNSQPCARKALDARPATLQRDRISKRARCAGETLADQRAGTGEHRGGRARPN